MTRLHCLHWLLHKLSQKHCHSEIEHRRTRIPFFSSLSSLDCSVQKQTLSFPFIMQCTISCKPHPSSLPSFISSIFSLLFSPSLDVRSRLFLYIPKSQRSRAFLNFGVRVAGFDAFLSVSYLWFISRFSAGILDLDFANREICDCSLYVETVSWLPILKFKCEFVFGLCEICLNWNTTDWWYCN